MIIWIIVITIILICWFQYPTIKDNNKNKDKYKYIFNHIKIPLIVICIVLLVYSSDDCKQPLDVELGIIKF